MGAPACLKPWRRRPPLVRRVAAVTLSSIDRVLLDEVVHTDYGQLDLIWDDGFGFDGDFVPFFDGQVNGLVGAARAGGVYLVLAR